ncbi:MAG: hypothetical protein ACYDCH_13705 [Gaiellaceae bacterium]
MAIDDAALKATLAKAGWALHDERPEVTTTVVVEPGRFTASNGAAMHSAGTLAQLVGVCMGHDADRARRKDETPATEPPPGAPEHPWAPADEPDEVAA